MKSLFIIIIIPIFIGCFEKEKTLKQSATSNLVRKFFSYSDEKNTRRLYFITTNQVIFYDRYYPNFHVLGNTNFESHTYTNKYEINSNLILIYFTNSKLMKLKIIDEYKIQEKIVEDKIVNSYLGNIYHYLNPH